MDWMDVTILLECQKASGDENTTGETQKCLGILVGTPQAFPFFASLHSPQEALWASARYGTTLLPTLVHVAHVSVSEVKKTPALQSSSPWCPLKRMVRKMELSQSF